MQRTRGMLVALLFIATIGGLVVLALEPSPRPTQANHAFLHSEGIGFDGIGPGGGWANVYIDSNPNRSANTSTTLQPEAVVAIDKWRAYHDGSLWFLRYSDNVAEFNEPPDANGIYPGVGGIEILDSGRHSVFCCATSGDGYTHSIQCFLYYSNGAHIDKEFSM